MVGCWTLYGRCRLRSRKTPHLEPVWPCVVPVLRAPVGLHVLDSPGAIGNGTPAGTAISTAGAHPRPDQRASSRTTAIAARASTSADQPGLFASFPVGVAIVNSTKSPDAIKTSTVALPSASYWAGCDQL